MNILVSSSASAEVQNTFFTERVKTELETCGDVKYAIMSRDELRDSLGGVDVLFGNWGMPQMTDDFLTNADKLKLVCYTGGSVAGIMTEEMTAHGIRLICGNRLYANSVAEGTIGYIIAAQRRLVDVINETHNNGWASYRRSDGIRFKTIGIIGFGMIAKNLAKMMQAFECTVKICSDYFLPEMQTEYRAQKCDMDEIFETCDIVSLHESLREDTYHMIDAHYFEKMKPDALFVNTARGAIIVEDDLAKVCREGRIRAILDVYEREPLPADSSLRGIEGIYLVPHRGGPTTDIREYVTLALIGDLRRFIAGIEPLEHEIDLEYAKHMTASTANFIKK